MDQSKTYNHVPYNSMQPENEELGSVSQGFMQNPTGPINANLTPVEVKFPEAKPVLNYSIQTGEEFAFEFMRDRVKPRKPFIPYAAGDPSHATGYLELKGILGISHAGSESGSDISMLSIAEKGSKEFVHKNTSVSDNNYASGRSVQQTSLDYSSNRTIIHEYSSSGASDSSSTKIKILCSFGGKILPRPGDGKLRYVGGETRIIRIRKDITWQELWQKAISMYNETHAVKYQLPGEDLDALVSVSCDEDLQNMMEECNILRDGEGSKKLRMFLFSISDLDDSQFGLTNSSGDSDIQYVVAVNGMDMGSRRDSTLHGLTSSSANNLNELDVQNVGKDTTREPTDFVNSNTPLTSFDVASSTTQTSQSTLPSSSNAFEAHAQFHQGQMMQHGEATQNILQKGSESRPNYPPFADSAAPLPFLGHATQQSGLSEGQPTSALSSQDTQTQVKDIKQKRDGSLQQEGEHEKIQSSRNDYPVPSQPFDGNVMDYFPVGEESVVIPSRPGKSSLKPSKSEGRHQESVRVSLAIDAINPTKVPEKSEENELRMCTTAFASESANSESDLIDLSYLEPPVPPQRVFRSERIPREQAELLNRLTKSDDSLGSQFLITHSLSETSQQELNTESVDKLHSENLPPQTEQSASNIKVPHTDRPQTSDDGLSKVQKSKEAVQDHVKDEGAVIEDQDLKAGQETTSIKDNHKTALVHETAEIGSQVKNLDDPASSLPEFPWGDKTDSDFSNSNPQGHAPPSAWTTSSKKDVSGREPSVGVSRPERGDILIDINDRFPRDFLSDIFSKAMLSEESPGIGPLPKDGAGLSLNIANHEPKHWSFFQKLAQNEFAQKDLSLIDQDHLGFSSGLPKVEEEAVPSYQFSPLVKDKIPLSQIDSQSHISVHAQKDFPGTTAADTIPLPSDYNPSRLKSSENMQFNDFAENIRVPDSEYEDGIRNLGLAPLDPSLDDFDISSLQIIKNEDLEELKELGSGTFGTVYHGKWRGTDVAIKRIKKSCFAGRSSEQERLTVEFWREAEILSKLHHPNVVAFYGVVQDGPGGTLATVAEFMVDGSLRHVLLRKDRHLDYRKKLIIAMDAAFGMEYLHSKNIVHFDLKCDNLLVNLKDPSRPICKVGDFGLSKIKRNTLVSGGVRGTLPWMAPELLNGSSNKVSEKVDVFSFGIVLWEILTCEEPYANMHYGAIIGGIVSNTLRPTIPSQCDPEWRRLMEQCWAPKPAVRPSFTEITRRLRVMSAACQTKAQAHKASS
ncbi:hypothetical protein RJ639_011802 [Escallonia herrerae]|uniref:Protein kinase domain-containing protein n=1 Tax=Escallonia herrerae TaxID=1293975 RepID=A0AA88VR20_9ASTE|nr:hypothetical protein RJ639_011802 [Escallonia herrerae]